MWFSHGLKGRSAKCVQFQIHSNIYKWPLISSAFDQSEKWWWPTLYIIRIYTIQSPYTKAHQIMASANTPLWDIFLQFVFWVDIRKNITLCVFVNGELVLVFLELSLSFYGRPNISDRFTFHFIRIQIFQKDFHLILYL